MESQVKHPFTATHFHIFDDVLRYLYILASSFNLKEPSLVWNSLASTASQCLGFLGRCLGLILVCMCL